MKKLLITLLVLGAVSGLNADVYDSKGWADALRAPGSHVGLARHGYSGASVPGTVGSQTAPVTGGLNAGRVDADAPIGSGLGYNAPERNITERFQEAEGAREGFFDKMKDQSS